MIELIAWPCAIGERVIELNLTLAPACSSLSANKKGCQTNSLVPRTSTFSPASTWTLWPISARVSSMPSRPQFCLSVMATLPRAVTLQAGITGTGASGMGDQFHSPVISETVVTGKGHRSVSALPLQSVRVTATTFSRPFRLASRNA